MDTERFDAIVRAWATTGSRRKVLAGLLAATVAGLRPRRTAAEDDIAAAGNGGTAEASANGGAVATGNINSGGNSGHAIGVGDTWGDVAVDGGASANATSLDVSANGGTGIADASGGDENVAFEVDGRTVSPPGPTPNPPEPPTSNLVCGEACNPDNDQCPAGCPCVFFAQDEYYCTAVAESDRNIKADFAEVDQRAILDGVLALPIETWTYQQTPSVRHIGPMAQDFAAVFGVGDSDRHIHLIDGQGVALAAIQGLYAELVALREANAALDHRLREVEGERN